ncbi:carboxylic ester hydrolase-like [Planococcus citri]|uniref:carboxylic ester hydrolase-like n=1 Tax=Planococcus citri TaxID=170843 RepID=UPI0031F95477
MYKGLCLFLLLTLIAGINGDVVKLKTGSINGTTAQWKNGRLYQQFYGIPFAEPPVGELRFKPPVPVKPWSGIRNTSEPPPKCVQPEIVSPNETRIIGQEDCLYLNVFVPNELFNSTGKAPVMVAIHGGAYRYGDGAGYHPGYLMNSDIIIVTMNYRMGILGFFGLNNDKISGNFGMKDQSLALRWVKENIEKFGGDPNQVTLMGESTGAACVHLHMFSPLSKGLFQRAILQSGSAFSVWSHHGAGYGEAMSRALLIVSGCQREDSRKISKCLQRIPFKEFYDLENKLRIAHDEPRILFKPMIESHVKKGPFLTKKPTKTSYLTKVPWLTGINSGEGGMKIIKYLRNNDSLAKIVNKEKNRFLPLINEYIYSADPEDIDNMTQKISDFYFGKEDIGTGTALKFVDMMTDSTFLVPFVKAVQSNHNRQYVYLYDHYRTFTLPRFAGLTMNLGVCHADELPLLFPNKYSESDMTPQDEKISKILLNFWSNFIITGDPNGDAKTKVWEAMKTNDIEYLHIETESLTMEKKLLKDRFDFWNALPTGWEYD